MENTLIVPAIYALVEFVKSFGLKGKALTLVSAGIGVLFYLVSSLLPDAVSQKVFQAVVFGLAASGFYNFGKLISGVKPPSQAGGIKIDSNMPTATISPS